MRKCGSTERPVRDAFSSDRVTRNSSARAYFIRVARVGLDCLPDSSRLRAALSIFDRAASWSRLKPRETLVTQA